MTENYQDKCYYTIIYDNCPDNLLQFIHVQKSLTIYLDKSRHRMKLDE